MANIIIYSTPWCVFCQMAKAFFKKHNIEFTEIDVSENEAAQAEMIKKSEQMGVPVIDINGQIIIGFDEKTISKILNIK